MLAASNGGRDPRSHRVLADNNGGGTVGELAANRADHHVAGNEADPPVCLIEDVRSGGRDGHVFPRARGGPDHGVLPSRSGPA